MLLPQGDKLLTEMYPTTSALPTTEADIRFTGSTEYSARTFLIALVCKSHSPKVSVNRTCWRFAENIKAEIHTDQSL